MDGGQRWFWMESYKQRKSTKYKILKKPVQGGEILFVVEKLPFEGCILETKEENKELKPLRNL